MDVGPLKTLMIITAYIAPFFFIPAAFKFAGGVLANLSGAVNNRSRGIFDRQRKFRERDRADNYSRFKAGDRGSFLGRYGRAMGRGTGAVAGAEKGAKWRTLTNRETRQQATTRIAQQRAAEVAQKNGALQQLGQQSDDGIAVMALGGETAETAREAANDLRGQWMRTVVARHQRDQQNVRDRLANGTITQAQHDTEMDALDQRFETEEGEVTERADRAFNAAAAVGFNRSNAQAAFQMMAQNKSRAIDPGNWGIIQRGINRLGRNNTELEDLANSFQFHSRGAGRFDIGNRDVRAGVNRAGLYQLGNAHPSTIRGATAAHMETFTDPGAHTDEERMAAARYFNELRSILPSATGEVRDAINEALGVDNTRQVRDWLRPPGVVHPPRTRVDPSTGNTILAVHQELVTEQVPGAPPGTTHQVARDRIDPNTGLPDYDTRTDREIESTQNLRTYQRDEERLNNP